MPAALLSEFNLFFIHPYLVFLDVPLFNRFTLLPHGPIKSPIFLFIVYGGVYCVLEFEWHKKTLILHTWNVSASGRGRLTTLSLLVAVFIPNHLLLIQMCFYKYKYISSLLRGMCMFFVFVDIFFLFVKFQNARRVNLSFLIKA